MGNEKISGGGFWFCFALLWMLLISLVSRQQAGVNNSSASAKSTQREFAFKISCELERKRVPTY
jgi:hypothetical protein